MVGREAARRRGQAPDGQRANANSWSSTTRLLEEAKAKGMALPRYLLLQEHRCETPQAGCQLSKWARRRSWKAAIGKAQDTGPGPLESSGGTAVLATRTRGSKQARSLPHWGHGWVAAEVDLCLQVKVIVASVYVEHAVGLEGDVQLLQEIGIELRKGQCPWIIGGD